MMNDLISRQAAIDAIYHAFCYAYCNNCEKKMNEDLCGECHRKYQNWSASKKVIEKVINSLPSAQPDVDSRIEQTIRVLQKNYNLALSRNYIQNPIAWALYETWKEFDR